MAKYWGASTLETGEYTPTGSIVTNLDAITTSILYYTKIGDTVTVFGTIILDATATGAVEGTITLPIASVIGNAREVAGSITSSLGAETGSIVGDVTANEARLRINTSLTAAETYAINFSYKII